MSVRVTYEKGSGESKITITKDGGFSRGEVADVMGAVDEALEGGEEKEPEMVTEGERSGSANGKEQRSQARGASAGSKGGGGDADTTPPAGRGRGAGELPDGTGVTKEGTVDRRTLRGSPENPDPDQQAFIERARATGAVKPREDLHNPAPAT